MKKAFQQLGLALLFGLGIPGLILGIAAAAEKQEPLETTALVETTEAGE